MLRPASKFEWPQQSSSSKKCGTKQPIASERHFPMTRTEIASACREPAVIYRRRYFGVLIVVISHSKYSGFSYTGEPFLGLGLSKIGFLIIRVDALV